jgi:serine/threonine-protein kinase
VDKASLHPSSIGDYRLVDFIGAGGMGEVYRAVHSKIERVVAVKILKNADQDPRFIQRFLNEARIQSRLNHPHVATLYDFLECEGRLCIIMEYVDGQTVAERIRAMRRLPLLEALTVFQAVVEAIHYIHSQGIVHRDIKSGNVKINSTGQVKLLDFGIAKSDLTPSLTMSGGVVGTLQYLSPEQLKGGVADACSDIWALGVLLYEMVTGQMPFEAKTIGDLYESVSKATYAQPSVLNPSVPRGVEAVIARCLKRNPADRYPSARHLLQDVQRLVALQSQSQREESAQREVGTPKWTSHRWLMVAAAIAALAVLIVAGFYFSSHHQHSAQTNPPSRTQDKPTMVAPPPKPQEVESDAPMQRVMIDVADGKAEVHRGDELLGTTPLQLNLRLGSHVELTLKREGFKNQPVHVDVNERKKEYIERMFREE